MSPIVTIFKPFKLFLWFRMVKASSNPCEGCACMPSPALMMGISISRESSTGAPELGWRITMASTMDCSVRPVSFSDSPFSMLAVVAWMTTVEAPKLLAAISKLVRVRVEFS